MLNKTNFKFPDWIDLADLRNSKGKRFEVYASPETGISEFIQITHSLVGGLDETMQIAHMGDNPTWGDFCLDTWNISANTADYSVVGKRKETVAYLELLQKSGISPTYTGVCTCDAWNSFLEIVLACIFNHIAPYSIVILLPDSDLFFYFHHSRCWGVYYRELNSKVSEILDQIAERNLRVAT